MSNLYIQKLNTPVYSRLLLVGYLPDPQMNITTAFFKMQHF